MLPAAIGVVIYCATTIGNNIWLSMWTDDSSLPHPDQNTTLRLSVYGAFGFGLSEYKTNLWEGVERNSLARSVGGGGQRYPLVGPVAGERNREEPLVRPVAWGFPGSGL